MAAKKKSQSSSWPESSIPSRGAVGDVFSSECRLAAEARAGFFREKMRVRAEARVALRNLLRDGPDALVLEKTGENRYRLCHSSELRSKEAGKGKRIDLDA